MWNIGCSCWYYFVLYFILLISVMLTIGNGNLEIENIKDKVVQSNKLHIESLFLNVILEL